MFSQSALISFFMSPSERIAHLVATQKGRIEETQFWRDFGYKQGKADGRLEMLKEVTDVQVRVNREVEIGPSLEELYHIRNVQLQGLCQLDTLIQEKEYVGELVEAIPRGVWRIVFNNLSAKERKKCLGVCKKWRDAIKNIL